MVDVNLKVPAPPFLAAKPSHATGGSREQRAIREARQHEGGGIQLVIEFSEEEKRQRQADVASWRTRLAQFDRDLQTEPDRIREFCEVRAKRVEPIGLVYLRPDTG